MVPMTAPPGADGRPVNVPRSVFITGASGFIGRALADRYRALGADVRGMDLRPDPERNVVAGDLADPAGWRGHVEGCELFIHTAAVVSMNAEWDAYRLGTVQGTRHCLDVAREARVARFVHFSSVAAMGFDLPPDSDETRPTVIGPDFRYGVAKAASEHLVLAEHAAGRLSCTVIRPGDVYGPGGRAWILEPFRIVRAGNFLLPGKGEGVFSPVYIDDVVDGTLLAAGQAQGAGEIFILSGTAPVSCIVFFAHHWRWAGKKGQPRTIPHAAALRLSALQKILNRYLGKHSEVCPDSVLLMARTGSYSIAKARAVLGYEPKMPLDDGMARCEQWLRAIGELA